MLDENMKDFLKLAGTFIFLFGFALGQALCLIF